MLSENTKNKLRGLGIEPEGMMQRLSQHIGEGKTFASPQQYATEVQRKQTAGQPLSDPQTAREFQQIAPALFGKEPAQTAFPFNVGQVPQQLRHTLEPEAYNMLTALAQYQRETPFTIPYAPGTPTIDEKQFAAKQDLAEREFAYRKEQDAIANALAWARIGGGSSYGTETPWDQVDRLIAMGVDLDTVMRYVDTPENRPAYKQYGETVDSMRDYARGKYAGIWQNVANVSAPPRGAAPADVGRGFRQLETAMPRLKEAQTWGMEPPKFTEADYQKIAEATGRQVEEIKWLDAMGMLEDLIKTFYGQQFRYDKPEGAVNFYLQPAP